MIEIAIVVAVVLGSIGYVGNGMLESRRGAGHPVLRWLRNAALIVVWPLIVLREFV